MRRSQLRRLHLLRRQVVRTFAVSESQPKADDQLASEDKTPEENERANKERAKFINEILDDAKPDDDDGSQ